MTCQPQAIVNLTAEHNITYETLWVSKITHFNAEIPVWMTNSQAKACYYISSYTLFNSAAPMFVRNNYDFEKKLLNISLLISLLLNWDTDHETIGIKLFLNLGSTDCMMS